MAAPNETVWGPIVQGSKAGRQGKLGIYTKVTNTDTKTTVNIQVWFATIYSCSDGDGVGSGQNCVYCDYGPGISSNSTAATARGERSIQHQVNTGSGWSASNQTLVYEVNVPYDRKETAYTYYVCANLTGIDMLGATVYGPSNISYTIPALAKYTITYNNNVYPNSNSLPAQQTRYYGGAAIKIASTPRPTNANYNCVGWITAPPEMKPYKFGESYSANANLVLYAQWTDKICTIMYDSNGGNPGATTKQSKKYSESSVTLLTSAAPSRANYNFLGWSTDPNAKTPTWTSGGFYSGNGTANYDANGNEYGTITLYAVWELAYVPPIIKDLNVERSDSEGNATDEGTFFNISFTWNTDENFSGEDGKIGAEGTEVSVTAVGPDGGVVYTNLFDISGFEGAFEQSNLGNPIDDEGNGPISTEYNYTITIVVQDTHDSATVQRTLMSVAYPIDVFREGTGVSFGKPASGPGFHVAMDAYFDKPINNLTYNIPSLFYGDCNKLINSGKYYIGNNGLNKPDIGPGAGLNGWLESTLYSTDYCYQRYTTYTGLIYERLMSAGVWSNWKLMYGSGGWTPTLVSGASSWTGFSGCTYYKTGNIVHVSIACWSAAAGRNSSPLQFTLPFRVASVRSHGLMGYSNLNNTNYANCFVLAVGGNDYFEIMYHNNLGQQVALTGADVGKDDWTFQCSLTYGTND